MKLAVSSTLDGQEELYVVHVWLRDETVFSQSTFTRSFFFGQNVALERMLPFDLTRSSKRKTLFSTGIGFHLRHKSALFWFVLINYSLSVSPIGTAKVGNIWGKPTSCEKNII
jgi:hypothetical protein